MGVGHFSECGNIHSTLENAFFFKKKSLNCKSNNISHFQMIGKIFI